MRLPLIAVTAIAAVAAIVLLLIVASSSTEGAIQGDADCNGAVDAEDALADLITAAGAEPAASCVDASGDVNCDEAVGPADVLALLVYTTGLPATELAASECAAIGEQLATPTPERAADSRATALDVQPASSATSAFGPAASGPPRAGSPTSTPAEDVYVLAEMIGAEALGGAAAEAVELALIPGAPGEAVIVLRTGEIYRISLEGDFEPASWGDLGNLVRTENPEEGLLSLAFSPGYEDDGLVYVYYTPADPEDPDDTVVARFGTTGAGLDNDSRETVITTPAGWGPVHQGGHLVFDRDGYLMLSVGDGGFGQDFRDAAQDLDQLLGKLIRIDVSQQPYAIPPDNPFAGVENAREEVYAYGFRNPWRFTIDSLTGEVWLGDVGEGRWEEVNRVVAGGNYGWDCREGPDPFEVDEQCAGQEFIEPRAVYDHDAGIAIVGGYVYRGSAMPELYGWYVYADYATGAVWAVNTADEGDAVQLTDASFFLTSFAELPDGELLLVSFSEGVYRLTR